MVVQGSQRDGENDLLVFVDELPSSRIEDASSEVWAEAREFYRKQAFEIYGTFEGAGQIGYRFAAVCEE